MSIPLCPLKGPKSFADNMFSFSDHSSVVGSRAAFGLAGEVWQGQVNGARLVERTGRRGRLAAAEKPAVQVDHVGKVQPSIVVYIRLVETGGYLAACKQVKAQEACIADIDPSVIV